MHTFELGRLPGVDLDDDAFGLLNPGFVVAERGAGHQAAVLQHGGDFDEREVKLAEEAVLHELRHVAEVDVHVLHFAGVDPLAGFGVGLVREPQMNAAGHGERAVELRSGGGAGENADLKLLAAQVGVGNTARQRHRNCLGIAGASESAHADLVAGLDERGSFFGVHDAVGERGVQDAGSGGNGSGHRRNASQS